MTNHGFVTDASLLSDGIVHQSSAVRAYYRPLHCSVYPLPTSVSCSVVLCLNLYPGRTLHPTYYTRAFHAFYTNGDPCLEPQLCCPEQAGGAALAYPGLAAPTITFCLVSTSHLTPSGSCTVVVYTPSMDYRLCSFAVDRNGAPHPSIVWAACWYVCPRWVPHPPSC